MKTGIIIEIPPEESEKRSPLFCAQTPGPLQKVPSLVMPSEESPQSAPPEVQPLPSRVSDSDLGAREQDWNLIFMEMAQLVEEPLAFMEDLHPPITPAVNPADPDLEPLDAFTLTLVKVLEIVPDVQPDHVTALVHSHLDRDGEAMPTALLVEQILHQLFEDPDYPKAEKKKEKRKSTAIVEESAATGSGQNGGERPKKKVKIDYRTTERDKIPSGAYINLALVGTLLLIYFYFFCVGSVL